MFLVLGPVRALTCLGTVPPDAAALATAAAHQKSRRGEVQRSLAAFRAEAPAEARPMLSQAGPALNYFHKLFWRYTPVEGPYILSKISFVLKVVVGPAASRAASGHGSDRVYTVPTVP